MEVFKQVISDGVEGRSHDGNGDVGYLGVVVILAYLSNLFALVEVLPCNYAAIVDCGGCRWCGCSIYKLV